MNFNRDVNNVLVKSINFATLNISNSEFPASMKAKSDNEIQFLVKLGPHFINEKNIRSLSRKGKGTLISQVKGNDIFVNIDYDKLQDLLKK
ncbi:MAG: hypothetical protein FD123_602 [Bacteroidetes bacterium]|nr:MAG: hypothetical protein FD123_602 [Bacteroidota bacterium]